MKMSLDYPIIRNGFDIDGDIKIAKFKRRGDFIITLDGNLEELPDIERELETISNKSQSVRINCTRDY